jgi:hypothetical protein
MIDLAGFFLFQPGKPALGPPKNYGIDIKGKIATKIFLTFHQLSGLVGRFMPLTALCD